MSSPSDAAEVVENETPEDEQTSSTSGGTEKKGSETTFVSRTSMATLPSTTELATGDTDGSHADTGDSHADTGDSSEYLPSVESMVPTDTGYEQMVQNIVNMGYEEQQVKLALRASFNDPETAIEYLLTEIPQQVLGEVNAGVKVEPVGTDLSTEGMFSMLPDSVVFLIFKNLEFKDLYNMQFVDEKCKQISQKIELWSDKEFKISKEMSNEYVNNMLRSIPKVNSIVTIGKHTLPLGFLDTILNSPHNLGKLNCNFDPSLLASDVERIIDRYPNICSLRVDNADNLQQKMAIILQVQTICEILISKRKEIRWFQITDTIVEEYANVCTMIQQRPLLKLDISGLYLESDNLNESFSQLLDSQKDNLTSLFCALRNHQSALEKIQECRFLNELDLIIHYRYPTNFDYDLTLLKDLKLLTLTFQYHNFPPNYWLSYKAFVTRTLVLNLKPNSFPSLSYLKLSVTFSFYDGRHILSKIVSSCPKLKVLKLAVNRSSTIYQDIKKLKNLSFLEEFSLSTFTKLSDDSIEWISYVKSLKRLKFKNCIAFMAGSINRKMRRVQEMAVLTHRLPCLKYLVLKSCYFIDLPANLKNELIVACDSKQISLVYDTQSIDI